MEESYEQKKQEVINWLKELGRLSTSRFIGLLGSNYETIKKILSDLESEGKIKKEEETNAVYWILVEENEI